MPIQFETNDGDLYEGNKNSNGCWHLTWPEGDQLFYGTRIQALAELKAIAATQAP